MRKLFLYLVGGLIAAQLCAADYTKVLDIPYKDVSDSCKLDIAYVEGAKDRPVIVWFHGGGLTSGNKSFPETLLKKDYTVVSVNYRLYPAVSVKEILDDAAAATAWVVNNVANYSGSVSKIYFAGHSAGGYIVSMLSLDKHYLASYGVNPDSFAAIVPYSGQMITHYTERQSRGIPKMQPIIDEMAPLYHIRPDAAPFLVITGDRELEMMRRYEENAYFVEMMKLCGHKDVILYEEDGFNHSGMRTPGHHILMKYITERTQ